MATSPLSLAQFGQRIKAKHPEYADMDDADLGKRVLGKYPEYGDMVAPDVPKAPQVQMQKLGTLDAGGGWSPDDLLRGAGAGIKNVFAHPLQTIASMGAPLVASGMSPNGYGSTAATGRPQDSQSNAQVQTQAQQGQADAAKSIAQNPAYAVGQVAGPALATAGAAKLLEVGAPPVGRVMQSAGEGIINKTVGALKKDYARGANPGKGYFQAGLGPSMSMDSIASKASGALDKTGQKLGGLYDDATAQGMKIPTQQVKDAINPPISKTRSVVMGPGGTMDSAPINQFEASFNPSIQSADAAGGYSPRDLFGVKRNVAENTNWSDPTQVGMKQLRQQTTGAIGNVLTDNVPGTADLNSQYQNLLHLADRADTRALTGSSPLTHLVTKSALGAGGAALGYAHSPASAALGAGLAMAADSIPARTSLASALYYGGKGAVAVGNGIKGLYSSPLAPPRSPIIPPRRNP